MIRSTAILTIVLGFGWMAPAARASISIGYSYAEGAIANANLPWPLRTHSVSGAANATATNVYGGFSSTATAQATISDSTIRISAFFEQSRAGLIESYSRGLVQIAFTLSEDMAFSLSGGISNLLGYTLLFSAIADSLHPDVADDLLIQYGAQGLADFSPGNVNLWGYGSLQGTLYAGREYVWSVEAFTDAEFGFSAATKYQNSSMALVLEPLVTPDSVAAVPEPASMIVWLLLTLIGSTPWLLHRLRSHTG